MNLIIMKFYAISRRAFSSSPLNVPEIQKCFYQTLGVKKDANRQEVRDAYLKIAKEWHPDKVDGHPEALAYFTHVS